MHWCRGHARWKHRLREQTQSTHCWLRRVQLIRVWDEDSNNWVQRCRHPTRNRKRSADHRTVISHYSVKANTVCWLSQKTSDSQRLMYVAVGRGCGLLMQHISNSRRDLCVESFLSFSPSLHLFQQAELQVFDHLPLVRSTGEVVCLDQ